MTKPSRLVLALLATVFPAVGAFAAPATPEEADRLKTLFERYLGHPAAGQPPSVTVTPEGSAYRASFDIKQMILPLEKFGVSVDPVTSTMLLTPNDDGTWKVSADTLPTTTVHMKDQTMVMRSSTYMFEGTFDPKLGAFTTSTLHQEGMTSDQDSPATSQHQRIGRIDGTMTSVPADGNTASVDAQYTLGDMSDDVTIQPPKPQASEAVTPTAAPMAFSYKVPSGAASVSAAKLHMTSLLDVWAFLVAHPSQDALAAAQDELRGLLRAALPLFAAFKESGSADDLTVSTQVGLFSAHKIASSLALDGLAGSGTMGLTLSLDGLKVPSQDLPVWSVGFLPTALDIKPTVTGFHFDEAVRETVDDFDLKASQPFTPEQSDKFGHIFWPGDGKLTLAPSRITSGLLDIRLEGEATLGSALSGHLLVNATGLDKAIETLQEATASDPSAQQVLAQFILAKNLAKPGPTPGSFVWDLATDSAGPVTVNGTPLQ